MPQTCPKCGGKGTMICRYCGNVGAKCYACKGKGLVEFKEWGVRNGAGEIIYTTFLPEYSYDKNVVKDAARKALNSTFKKGWKVVWPFELEGLRKSKGE